MKDTYKAVEVSAPGVLRVVERQVSEPEAGQVAEATRTGMRAGKRMKEFSKAKTRAITPDEGAGRAICC